MTFNRLVRCSIALVFLILPFAARAENAPTKLRIVNVQRGHFFKDFGVPGANPTELPIEAKQGHPAEIKLFEQNREIVTLISDHAINRSNEDAADFSINPERVVIKNAKGRFSYIPPNFYVWANIHVSHDPFQSIPKYKQAVERIKNQAAYGAPIVLGEFNLADERFLIIAEDNWGRGPDLYANIPKRPSGDQRLAPNATTCSDLFRTPGATGL